MEHLDKTQWRHKIFELLTIFYKYRKLHATREYIFFSNIHTEFIKLDSM